MYTITIKHRGRTLSVKADDFSVSPVFTDDDADLSSRVFRIWTPNGLITCNPDSVISVKKYQPYQKRKHH